LNITTSNANPTVGESFIITYKLGNYGPDTAENVTINFQIPEGMEFVGITVDSGTWNYKTSTRTVTWTLDNVPVGDPYLYLTVKAIKSGSYSITPSITSDTYNWNTNIPTLTINIKKATPVMIQKMKQKQQQNITYAKNWNKHIPPTTSHTTDHKRTNNNQKKIKPHPKIPNLFFFFIYL